MNYYIRMPQKSVSILFILLYSIFINGQSGPDFNILLDKAFQKLYQDPDDCINYSQSLLISDQNIEHKIILHNIISQAYAMKGDYVQSVNVSTQKEVYEEKDKLSYFMQVFGDYDLADQYQNLDLYDQSQRIISNLLANKKLLTSDDPKLKITVAELYQLQAINFGINRNYPLAIENIKKSNQYIDTHNEENRIISTENKIFHSSYLLKQNKLEEAKKSIESVIIDLEKKQDQPFLSALAYENFSKYYFLKEDYNKAVENLEKGLTKIDKLPYNYLKAKIYESLSKNYFALHDDEKYYEYNKLYAELKAKLDSNNKEGIRYIIKLVETNQNKNIEFQKQNEQKKIWTLASVFLLIITLSVIYYLIETRRKKDLKKQFEFFAKQKNRTQTTPIYSPGHTVEVVQTEKIPENNKLSKEKEFEILQKLNEWEKSDLYLNKNMSLSTLSAQMGINTKYLSEVINNSKGKNFNGYINELRINHIAHLLKTNPTYLNYKVSYLAEFSGFSSHSAFTTVFKSVTGMSPNAYIQEISKNRVS
ncbi:AraC family transcriptional regulator [Chryseobacterium daecheongense]|uniref:helix-turn-helix domain-containing protein n=1 Tax=Chryseobacterium daecheongense TaxID=192389 RepID=UPI001FD64B12|nr:helix-turn-helix domain-containing protein [Chryseobacterium daecheongense]UOU96800.1 AraC family transcriptional regulator [Chryseobacterium daecheongense]